MMARGEGDEGAQSFLCGSRNAAVGFQFLAADRAARITPGSPASAR